MRRTFKALILALVVPWLAAQGQEVSLLAVGDINLGRHVGQVLLNDSLSYPFEFVRSVFRQHDIVFGNLESQITDQNGETQHPRDRYIFCAPPQGAQSLREAGVTIVATANNHAYDYKMRGLRETISYLDRAAVLHVGTSKDSVAEFPATIVEVHGIRVGFLATTQFVNRKKGWTGHIALYNIRSLQKAIRQLKAKADLVVVSYHGGIEYVDAPNKRTYREMRGLVDAGADVVLAHHPHVPQGIKRYKKGWIFCSLGNFVFKQPQREWTQKSFAVSMNIEKKDSSTRITAMTLLPVLSGFQPSFAVPAPVRETLERRLQRLSNVTITRKDTVFAIDDAQTKQ